MHIPALFTGSHPSPKTRYRRTFLVGLALAVSLACAGQSLSLSLKEAPLERALQLIEAQSPYRFVYTREEISGGRPLTLEVRGASLDSVLRLLFEGQPLDYSRLDPFIIVTALPGGTARAGRRVRSGVVRDEEGLPVAGATIRVKGSAQGTVADGAGAFVLPLTEPGSTLLVSAVGFQPSAVAQQGAQIIILRRLTPLLDETVVIGYGTTTRRKATGTVSKVAGRLINRAVAPAPLLLSVQGRAAGLLVTPASGLPDAPLSLRIRGRHSLQSGSDPLYLIDGVPLLLEGGPLSQRSGLQALAPFHPVASVDVESIEVLKDGDATAIYGSRAAGGVVLITTRPTVEGKGSGTVSLRRGWSRTGRVTDYLSTPAYRALRREAFRNDGAVPDPHTAPDLTVWDSTRDQRWSEQLLGGVAASTQAQLRYAGGRSGTTYALSGSLGTQGTVFPGDFYSRQATVRSGAVHRRPGGRFSAAASLALSGGRYRLPPQDLTASVMLPPNLYGPYDERGALQWSEGGQGGGNPLAVVHQPFTASFSQLTAHATVGYRPLPRLLLQSLWGGHRLSFSEKLLVPLAAQDPSRAPRGSAGYGSRSGRLWIWEPTAEYRFASQKTKGVLLAGATLQQTDWERRLITAQGYRDDALLGSLSHAPVVSAEGAFTRYRYSGLYGRISLEHRDQYLLQGTIRRDGSSRFGPGRQFAHFFALGGGWLFSREPAVRKVLPGLSHGKLRLSYGTAGNDRIGDYGFGDTWSPAPYPYGGGSAWKAERLYNPDFGWEVTRKGEVALEWGWWKDRLLLTIGGYRHRSGNLILRYPVAAQTGFTTVLRNFPGVVQNEGLELEAIGESRPGATPGWTTTVQLTVPRNRLLRFPGLDLTPYASLYQPGKPLSAYRGYAYGGVDPATGLYRFEDRSGDGTLDAEDQGYTGTTDPRYFGSVQQELRFKGWTVSALLYFVRGRGLHPVYSSGVAPGDLINMPRAVEDRWRRPGDRSAYQRATQKVQGAPYYPATHLLARSSAVLTDASFVRLNHLQLTYESPEQREKKTRWQWFLGAQHLLTLTGYPGDPEVQRTTILPPLRTLETGITLHF